MYLKQKISAVSSILNEADKHVETFQARSKLACISSCSLCCVKRNIHTTILEFLPAAYHLYVQGLSDEILDKIETRTDNMCVFHNPFLTNGSCSKYNYRGLLCRLFGYTKKTEKNGNLSLVSCKPMKQIVSSSDIQIALPSAPHMPDYYLKLYCIDPKLTVQYFHINESIKKALEIVLFHFQFTKKRA